MIERKLERELLIYRIIGRIIERMTKRLTDDIQWRITMLEDQVIKTKSDDLFYSIDCLREKMDGLETRLNGLRVPNADKVAYANHLLIERIEKLEAAAKAKKK